MNPKRSFTPLWLLLAAGCGAESIAALSEGGSGGNGGTSVMSSTAAGLIEEGGVVEEGQLVTHFNLPDLNPNSMSYGVAVSPRDYLERVSGWYFAHST